MSKDPAVLFYTSDFLTGTLTLSNEQKGKYITLLCLQHQKNFLTENDMMMICGSYDKSIFDKFVKEDDIFYNKRMRDEHKKRKEFSKSRSENRLNGLKNKKKEGKIISSSYVKHMENENVNVIIDYFNTNNYTKEAALQFYEYYKVNNFKDSNNKVVKNWKQKARLIWFKPENEIKDLTKTKMVY